MQNQKLTKVLVIVGVVIVVLLIFSSSMFITLQPGEKGVVFKRFSGGLDKENVQSQGFHVIAPWNKMIVYNVRQQQTIEKLDVLSSNGLDIKIDVSLWYYPVHNKIGYLHDEVGTDYLSVLVIPGVRASTRNIIGRYTPEEIYSTKRDEIAGEILKETKKKLADRHIFVKDVLIRSISLPPKIKSAIEKKLKQEQESLEYKFKLEVAKKEAERKKVEAEGIKQAQLIITKSLTDKLLKWQGIEA
ncbi:MAG: prohibitin family protein, partial [Bacteroidota bacterium]|nr:prohibitin family protein [Bacteroidota bacterium]